MNVPTRSMGGRPRHRLFTGLLVLGNLAVAAIPMAASAQPVGIHPPMNGSEGDGNTFVEVGRIPVNPEGAAPGGGQGWLVVNPGSRRAYVVFERGHGAGGGNLLNPDNLMDRLENPNPTLAATTIESFDIDQKLPASESALMPYRRDDVPGLGRPIKAGTLGGASSLGVSSAGEIIHAVDEEGHRIFLAIGANARATGADDTALPFERVAVIDEKAFDEGASDFSRDLRVPPDQASLLAEKWLKGMTFYRDPDSPDDGGKLLLLFAAAPDTPSISGLPTNRPWYDHYLVQWDVQTGVGDWIEPLVACARAPLVGPQALNKGLHSRGILRTRDGIYIACQSAPQVGQVVRIPLDAAGQPAIPPGASQQSFSLARPYSDVLADSGGGRLFLRAHQGGTTWWIFDAATRLFTGAFTGAPANDDGTQPPAAVSPATGRFYTFVQDGVFPDPLTGKKLPTRGGLAYTDARLPRVPQVTYERHDLAYPSRWSIGIDHPTSRFFVRRGDTASRYVYPGTTKDAPAPHEFFYRILEDQIPVAVQPPEGDDAGLTMQVQEQPGSTAVSYLATGSGFGTRALLIGGVDAVVDRELARLGSSCSGDDRELALGQVNSASLSDVAATAGAAGLSANPSTSEDAAQPMVRCWPTSQGPPTGGGLAGPSLRPGDFFAECTGDAEDTTRAEGGPERQGQEYVAEARCVRSEEFVEAFAHGSLSLDPIPVKVASSSSNTTLQRLDKGGVEVKVDSIARGIEVDGGERGKGTIGVIRLEATSTAKGRSGTAETKFVRTFCAVQFPNFEQQGCTSKREDHENIVRALNAFFGSRGEARIREPDPELAEGSPSGYQAAIQRDRKQLFQDQTISRDTSLAVPGLELIFFRGDDPAKGAGRQIFQFAGVQGSTSYGIECLFGREGDGCAEPPRSPDFLDGKATLALQLVDDGGTPLSGGGFTVHEDADGDGALGAADPPISDRGGRCTTADDGTGDCRFPQLEPGAYVVDQTESPPGYSTREAFPVTLAAGDVQTVTVTNFLSVGGVSVRLVDHSPEAKPLPGGQFELAAEGGTRVVAGCTTDADGVCPFEYTDPEFAENQDPSGPACLPIGSEPGCILRVPLGSYVLRQAAAPNGFEPADAVPFTLASPGDVARFDVVNAPPGEGESVAGFDLEAGGTPPVNASSITLGNRGGGGRGFLPEPLKDILAMLFGRSLGEAALLAAVWALLFLPCYLGERWRVLGRLESGRARFATLTTATRPPQGAS